MADNNPPALWTSRPDVQAILADCAARPPAKRYVRGVFGPNDGRMEYTGERVKRLNAIWKSERKRLWDQCDKDSPFNAAADAFAAHCRLSVQAAIEQAIQALIGEETKERRAA